MIVWSEKIKKVDAIFKAVSNELLKKKYDIDAIVEVFNSDDEEGMLLKVYDKYDCNIDLCIWAYLPSERDCNNQMKVIVGHHIDCLKNNMWNYKLPCKVFTHVRARNLHIEVRDYILETIISKMNREN